MEKREAMKQYHVILGLADENGIEVKYYYRSHAKDWVKERTPDTHLQFNEMTSSFDAILRDDEKMIPASFKYVCQGVYPTMTRVPYGDYIVKDEVCILDAAKKGVDFHK